ncbi:DUF2934 domain-containing protein [Horticoccus sp. 23ND18S-11]|uniref:DUF2934 domain-containing protein n=1 Tax=Horticoccus sp. 23ND18S-11 TaxID=3391832 RepID=UPI0039C8CB75
MNSLTSTVSTDLNADEVARRAYEIWQSEGCPDGCDQRHWLEAEQELTARASAGKVPASVPPLSEAAIEAQRPSVDVPLKESRRPASESARERRRDSATPFAARKPWTGTGR